MSRKKRKKQKTGAVVAMPVREGFGDLIDPTEYLTDEPGWGGGTIAAQLVSRKHGANAPTFQTDQELANIRGAARVICDVSVTAKCAMQNLGNYVIGQGFEYEVVDKDRVSSSDPATELATAANAIVEEFLKRTKYRRASRRKRQLWAKRRDGETFKVLWHGGGGLTEYRQLDPGYFITPQNVRDIDEAYPLSDGSPADWMFGVQTPDDDYERVEGYFAQYTENPADYEYFPVSRVLHSKINVDDAVKRGISDFYWIYSGLQDAAKLLRNGVRGGAVLAAIAAIVEHPPGVRQDQVNSFKTGDAVGDYTEPTRNGGRTRYVHRNNPGTVLHVPNGQKYQSSPLASQGVAGSIVELEQAVLRIIGSNWCMPEFMISGDASNNNYASILVSGSPFVKFVEAIQGDETEEDQDLLWMVLRIAYDSGHFARGLRWREVTTALDIEVTAPQPDIENKQETLQINDTLNQRGLLSDRTWARKSGLDYEQEQALGARRQEASYSLPLTKNDSGYNHTQLVRTDTQSTSHLSTENTPSNVTTTQSLNGAQITAAKDVLQDMVAGNTAPDVAKELLVAVGIAPERAQKMVDASRPLVGKAEYKQTDVQQEPFN
jgi:hypothetical protein